ncbi:MAG TPA: DUF1653 domain-containing protein [Bacilli bacterium]|nr:DUF1653 domain-containing protein [Bacilli bacterium]
MREVNKGEIYKHFKGHIYKIVCVATNSDDLRKQVIYQDTTNEEKIWVRDYDEFISLVDKNKYPDCTQEYRFELVK